MTGAAVASITQMMALQKSATPFTSSLMAQIMLNKHGKVLRLWDKQTNKQTSLNRWPVVLFSGWGREGENRGMVVHICSSSTRKAEGRGENHHHSIQTQGLRHARQESYSPILFPSFKSNFQVRNGGGSRIPRNASLGYIESQVSPSCIVRPCFDAWIYKRRNKWDLTFGLYKFLFFPAFIKLQVKTWLISKLHNFLNNCRN